MRTVLYLRVSTNEQAQDGYSIRAQRAQLVDYCRVNDYEVVDIYIDEGFSAKDMKRPALKRLLDDAQKGLFDAVIVYKLDRFTRSVRDLYELLDYLNKNNVGFISKQEKFDTTTAMGRAMIGLLAVFAQFERELIAERVRMGQEQKVKEGKKPGGRVAFGYDNKFNLIPEEAVAIRRLRELYMENKLGFKSIAIEMNKDPSMTRRGFVWRASTVALTLENPFYAGIIQFGGKMSNGKYPQRKRNLRVDVIETKGNHEAIFTEEEYQEHVSLMWKRTDGGYSRKLDYWFTGLLRCGRCGGSMFGKMTKKTLANGTIQRVPFYTCSRRKENNLCTQPIFRQVHIEHLMMDYINKFRITQEKLSEEKVLIKKETQGRKTRLQKLKRDLDGAKERIKKWQYMFVEGLVTADDLRKRLDEEYIKETEIKESIDELNIHDQETPVIQSRLFALSDLWGDLNDMEKKEILAEIFDEITLSTDEVNPKGVKNRFFDASIKVKYK